MDNSSTIALAKNPVYYLRDCIANKKVEVKYVKTQDQVVDIFKKPLKYDVFAKMRDTTRKLINTNENTDGIFLLVNF